MRDISGILHRKCTLRTSLGVCAFKPSLFEPRVACLVKTNGDFARTGESVRSNVVFESIEFEPVKFHCIWYIQINILIYVV